jgi:hypothetical protein
MAASPRNGSPDFRYEYSRIVYSPFSLWVGFANPNKSKESLYGVLGLR